MNSLPLLQNALEDWESKNDYYPQKTTTFIQTKGATMALKIRMLELEKERVARAKQFLKKMGMGALIPKMTKNLIFYKTLTEEIFTSELLQDHSDIPPHTMREIKEECRHVFRQPTMFSLLGDCDNPVLSIRDMRDFIFNLPRALRVDIQKGSLISEYRDYFDKYQDPIMQQYIKTRNMAMKSTVMRFSSLDGIGIFTYDIDTRSKCRDGQEMREQILIQLKKPETIKIVRDGKPRTAYQALFIPDSRLKIVHLSVLINGKLTPVYIQSHALRRIEERFDICGSSMAREAIFCVAHEKEAILYKGNYLIPCDWDEHRVGYLVCEMVDGICLITTFLFVVHNGTPEGDRFMESHSLTHRDVHYLQIDRLSQFFSHEIQNNKLMTELFESTDLGYMLNLNLQRIALAPLAANDELYRFLRQVIIDREAKRLGKN